MVVVRCDAPGCTVEATAEDEAQLAAAGWLLGHGARNQLCPSCWSPRQVPLQRAPEAEAHTDTAATRARAAGGDREAFAALWQANAPMLYRMLRRRGVDHHVAEDLVSSTIERALRRVDLYQEQGRGFGAWLTRIAQNLLVDYWKSSHVRLSAPVEHHDPRLLREEQDVWSVAAADPAVLAEASASAATLRWAIEQLTPQQADVLHLRFYSGLSVEETATKLDLTVGAVKALQYRAVRALQRLPEIQALAVSA